MRILLFGGSFDPPHRGHLALLKAACRRIQPDRILIVPAHQAPLKGRPGAPAKERLKLARLGLLEALPKRWRRRARIDDSEARSGRMIYTVDTLRRLARAHPGAELHFVVGSDSAVSFDRWKQPARLRRLARWWTARRPGAPRSAKGFGLLDAAMPDVSSTELRAALMLGEPTGGRLLKPVERLIRRRGLYGATIAMELRGRLKPSRFEHSRCVARLAESLARRWGLDPEKARLAGLLHDCGREIPVERMSAYALKHRLNVPELTKTAAAAPLLLHAYIGERVARARYGVDDPELLSAIRKHTLGDRSMSKLDRLLYVADSCSEDRRYPGVAALRRRAHDDLESAFKGCVRRKLADARRSGGWLHPMTERLWNSLRG